MGYVLTKLLSDAARRFPDKTAVVFQDERITYNKLDALSNCLAHTLRQNGVQRGDRVGILMQKSVAAVVSVFGVLKANAVYVPLDRSAPAKRIRYALRDCHLECVLSDADHIQLISQLVTEETPLRRVILTNPASPTTCCDGINLVPWQSVLQEHPTACEPECIETDLAYILYTSGSTGDPKGVMISHLNAATFIDWACDTTELSARDTVTSPAPLHFDLSIFELFASIKAGATICLVPAETARFAINLSEFIDSQQISIWYSVPSDWLRMLARGQLERFDYRSLRTVIFAGEVFPTKHLRNLMAQIQHAQYLNWYGPTETNVITAYQVNELPQDSNQTIPIGQACANMGVFALDGEGRLVSRPGVQGELYGRGACVAQGYWNDPEATKRRFVRNPLQPNYHEPVYRTGDLVRIDDAGNYIYLGRCDDQVKVQGYRIELGEIESALLGHPGVAEAAVLALRDEDQTTYLKACVVSADGFKLTPAELKRHCGKQIPKHMIPSEVEIRGSLPTTSTGKTDRKLLAAQSTN